MKLAIVITHPIQYYAPVFKLLAQRGKIIVKVFYTWERGAEKYDVGFGKSFEWDIPLLEGYDHVFVSNNGNMNKGFRDVRNPTLIREIEQWGADAVLVYGWNYHSHLKAMRHFKGNKQVLFRGDSTLLNEKKGVKQMMRRVFLRWVYSHVDAALYVGSHNKQYFLKHGLKEHQLFFAPHSIDNDRFAEITEKDKLFRDDLWRQLGIPPEARKFLFVGKLQYQKNPSLLVKAFIQLKRPGMHLLFVGNGDEEEMVKALAKPYPNIHFLPFQNQSAMPAIYRLGDAYCLTSVSETWGLAVNEAMACGRAVLVSHRVGCSVDLVKDGKNGYVFESGNVDDLVKKLEMLSMDDTDAMGAMSKQMINDWSVERQVECIESALLRN